MDKEFTINTDGLHHAVDHALGQARESKLDIPHPLVTLANKETAHEMA
jgi:hypothetical protein